MVERGSLAGRLWCGVWQSEHIAEPARPMSVALPWKLWWKVAFSFSWQLPHSCGKSWRAWIVVGSTTSWASWQSLHSGPPSLPSFQSWPWALSVHADRMNSWQLPQVSGLFARQVFDSGLSLHLMSCVPWQSVQAGELMRPLTSRALACELCR